MVTRREVLIYSAAAAGFGSIAIGKDFGRAFIPAEIIIVDQSIPRYQEVATHLFGRKAPVTEFSGDPINIWREHLLSLIKRRATTIGGITTGHDAYALSEMAQVFGAGILSCQPLGNDQHSRKANGAPSINSSEYFAWVLGPSCIRFR